MDHSHGFHPEDEEKKHSLKGFYIALALCLLAVAGVVVVTLMNRAPEGTTVTTTTGSGTNMSSTTTSTTQTTAKPVAGIATGVPDTRTTTTTAVKTTTTQDTTPLFVFPVSNVVVNPYSDRLVYSETLDEWRTHNGVDFEAEAGQKVKALADGTVLAIREDPLWGPVMELEHGDKLISRYCGIKPYDVKVGDTVTAGQIIGTISDVPLEIVGPAHLHLELIANGNYVDPLTLIQGEAVVRTTTESASTTTATQP